MEEKRWKELREKAHKPPFDKPFFERYLQRKEGEEPYEGKIIEGFENVPDISSHYTIRLFFRLDVADRGYFNSEEDDGRISMQPEEYNMMVEGIAKLFRGDIPEGLSIDEAEEFISKRNELLGDLGPFYTSGGNTQISPLDLDSIGGDATRLSERMMRLSIYVPADKSVKKSGTKKHMERISQGNELARFMEKYIKFSSEECANFNKKRFKLKDGINLNQIEKIGLAHTATFANRSTDKFASAYGGDENEFRTFETLNNILSNEFTTAYRLKEPYRPAGHMKNIRAWINGDWNKPDRYPVQEFIDDLAKNSPTWQAMTEAQRNTYIEWILPEVRTEAPEHYKYPIRNNWFHITADRFAGSSVK